MTVPTGSVMYSVILRNLNMKEPSRAQRCDVILDAAVAILVERGCRDT